MPALRGRCLWLKQTGAFAKRLRKVKPLLLNFFVNASLFTVRMPHAAVPQSPYCEELKLVKNLKANTWTLSYFASSISVF